MKRVLFLLVLSAFSLCGFQTQFILPTPREMSCKGTVFIEGGRYRLVDKFGVPASHISFFKGEMKRFFKLQADEKSPFSVEFCKIPGNGNKEFYTLAVSEKGVRIGASDMAGIHRASGRLFGIAEQLRIVPEKKGVKLPCLSIKDWPEYKFRGFHFQIGSPYSRYRFNNVLALVDRLGRLGYNAMIFELGGRVNCPAFPEITRQPAWPDAKIKELISFCRVRGLKAYPAFNGPGHLGAAPRIFPLAGFRDHGNGRKPVKELVMDISHPLFWKKYFAYLDRVIEVFEDPDFVAIGTDEFYHGAKILEEKMKLPQNVYYPAYLKKITDHLAKKNIRCGAWHDMMIDRSKYALSAYYTVGAANGVAGTLEKVPENCTIMYWNYGYLPRYRDLEEIRKVRPRNTIWVTAFSSAKGAEALFRSGRKVGSDHALGSLWGFPWHRIAIPAVAEFAWNTANVRKLDTRFFEECNDRFFFQRPAAPAVPVKAELLKRPFTPADTPPQEIPWPWNIDELVKKSLMVSTDGSFEMVKAQGVYKNTPRLKTGLWFYTPQYGKSTRTNMYGEEFAVVNGTVSEVSGDANEGKKGNMKIPRDGMVLSLRMMFESHSRTLDVRNQLKVGKKFRLYEVPAAGELKKHTFPLPGGTRRLTVRLTVKRPLLRKENLLKLEVAAGKKKSFATAVRGRDFITTRPVGVWNTFLVTPGIRPVIDVECALPAELRTLTVTPTAAGAMAGVTLLSISCR